MDIAIMQMASQKVPVAKQKQPQSQSVESVKTPGETPSFDKVFNEAVATSDTSVHQQSTDDTTTGTQEQAIAEASEVVEAGSLQALFDLLGIAYDESMMFAEIAGETIAIEEMLNLEDLTAALGMTEEQLKGIIQQLLGEETPLNDVWSVLEQAPALLAQIASALKGEHNIVTPKEAAQVVEFLKLAQMVGMKTDTVYQQEFQLAQTKDSLQSLITRLQPVQQLQQEAPKTVLFQQVVKQATQQSSAKETEAPQVNVNHQQTTTQTKTVTITLPAERSAQSEALVKEIQNLLNRSQISNQQGSMKLLLKLFPENLGQIRIELVQKDGIMTARLLASTAVGKELLDSNLQQLKTAFVAQNIQMERIDVAQSLQDAGRNLRDQNFFNNFFRQQGEEQEENKEDEDEEKKSFSEFLSEEV
ncbi:flagellar hook-length control protein FliK [Lysinibacillus sp. 54212]|uniref:flagellar hook-length control protein FliK n=1 Tax=Lysinibacillus sp. 54212 TaxID=3119829 RepID=UPI002FCBE25A